MTWNLLEKLAMYDLSRHLLRNVMLVRLYQVIFLIKQNDQKSIFLTTITLIASRTDIFRESKLTS
jgi:hypothetical protein